MEKAESGGIYKLNALIRLSTVYDIVSNGMNVNVQIERIKL